VKALSDVLNWPVSTAAVAVLHRSGDGGVTVAGQVGPAREPFRLASVTKPLAAYAVHVAVEEGALTLDDPAGPPAPPGATVAHLLAHASGLPFEGESPTSPPGRRRIYSNVGFELLGATVAAAAGMPFADYLAEAVFAPLGLTGARLDGSPAYAGYATLDDLCAFAAELLAPRLLAPETFARATTVAFPGLDGVLPGFGRQRPNDWGLGFELRGTKSPHWTGSANSPATFGHFGQSGTFVWVDPAVGVACVGLADRNFGDWARAAWPVLSDAVLAELAPAAR
jgi:CubicO group peptidase (beta-lactamase class C family)